MVNEKKTRSNKLTALLCLGLIITYMAQGIMITATKNPDGGYDYDKNVSVMLSEICKFFMSAGLLFYQHKKAINNGIDQPPLTSKLGWHSFKFAVPALLYALHNNIIFIALELLSPVSYQLFNNIKIVTTGLVFRLFLNRSLRLNQWMAIILLPLSMCVTQLGRTNNISDSTGGEKIFLGFLWMCALSSCSAFAGVYNEFLLKSGTAPSSLMWKNMQLYFFGTVACFVSFVYSRQQARANGVEILGLLHGFGPMAWGVVLLNGLLGQIISAIFMYADNIVKVYAASGAILLTPFVSTYFFPDNTTLDAALFIGISVALISLFLYFLPVKHLTAIDTELLAMINSNNSANSESTAPSLEVKEEKSSKV